MTFGVRSRVSRGVNLCFAGSITKCLLYDRAFHINYLSEAGPFPSVYAFHNWFTSLHKRQVPGPESIPIEPFRDDLPDTCAIKFTHGDLPPSNIITSSTRPYRVLAIIDWE
ncbi:uncharacterized protein BDV14DRAFT_171216 [Aspergillus stella-maris]|uniref:uncharacterized protein n=1 Tax=Aspergillus stella-maris TaxID=1810926 RepID=UPI003CCDF940